MRGVVWGLVKTTRSEFQKVLWKTTCPKVFREVLEKMTCSGFEKNSSEFCEHNLSKGFFRVSESFGEDNLSKGFSKSFMEDNLFTE